MRTLQNQEEAYNWCVAEGSFIPQKEINLGRIKSNLLLIEERLESAKDDLAKKRWNTAYSRHYDVLHLLGESFLMFDLVKARNHQCLFTYLCMKHPELELSWNFFEKIRTKRNGVNYYGTLITEKDWKEIELQINLYINLLKKEIKKKLDSLEE